MECEILQHLAAKISDAAAHNGVWSRNYLSSQYCPHTRFFHLIVLLLGDCDEYNLLFPSAGYTCVFCALLFLKEGK